MRDETFEVVRSGQHRQHSEERPTTPQLLRPSLDRIQTIGRSLAMLCDAKRIEFTTSQLGTWVAILGCCDPECVAIAATQLALGTDPFPSLGDLIARVRVEESKRSQAVSQADPSKPSAALVRQVMQVMGLGG
jgi:hypothetical protein